VDQTQVAGLFTAFFVAVGAFFSWRAANKAKKVDEKTSTNHGLEPWQYLEMVMEVRDDVLDLKASGIELKSQVTNLAHEVGKLREHQRFAAEIRKYGGGSQ
jgi:hypothetical protein